MFVAPPYSDLFEGSIYLVAQVLRGWDVLPEDATQG